MSIYDSRTRRVSARVGRGCGGHAEYGAVPAAGAARVARHSERHAHGVARRLAREAHVLGQRLQRHAARQKEARFGAVAGLQRGRGAAHRAQRGRRLAQERALHIQNTLL